MHIRPQQVSQILMVWLPWQCVLGRWVSSEWLSILSCFPTVAGDRLRVDWSPRSSYSDLALLGNTRTSLARGLGTTFGYSDRYLKVPKFLSICSISIYISQRPETALAPFSFLCYSPTVERRRVRKWKVGHRFCFCHLAPRPAVHELFLSSLYG